MKEYAEFLESKIHDLSMSGFSPTWLPDFLFDFQLTLLDWAVRKGRGAIFADCGLGKTPMQLVWAENVVRKTNKPVLVLTPLAVGVQTIEESEKFNIDAKRVSSGSEVKDKRIYVCNYEKLHHFRPDDFSGVVADESSILKSFDGVRKAQITEFMRTLPYRLLCTATAAPNDYTELGTSSEALGEMGYMDMLGRFFTNNQRFVGRNGDMNRGAFNRYPSAKVMERYRWRFKGHSQEAFWRWVCSWARACRKPSDLGFDDGDFVLTPLVEREHIVEARKPADGALFSVPAVGFREEREERRRTIAERCETAAALVENTNEPAVVWCHLNDEGNLLERLIDGSTQVSGADSDEKKEESYAAFKSGDARVLITKPKIGAWGLNWQHCAHVVTFASHSYEQYYQSVRRCWRFGQKRKVAVDIVASEGEKGAKDNLLRKSVAADKMFDSLIANMDSVMNISKTNEYVEGVEAPKWL